MHTKVIVSSYFATFNAALVARAIVILSVTAVVSTIAILSDALVVSVFASATAVVSATTVLQPRLLLVTLLLILSRLPSTRFSEILPLKHTFFKDFGLLLSNYLVFGKIVNLLRQIFHTFGQIFIVLNGQLLK